MTAWSRRNERFWKQGVTSAQRWQHPFEIEDPNWHRSKPLHLECEWKQGDSAREENLPKKKQDGRALWRLPLVGNGHDEKKC